MFDVGFWEILLILVLALVVIGPERLPGAARQAGFWVGKARRYIEGVRTEVEQELDVNEFKRMLRNQEVQINELQQQIKSSVDDVGSEISKDIPSSDFLSDVPSHTLQDEKPDESADPEEVKKSSKTDEEKS
ncbi:MAG: Sec-independent protein translocase protein TatB [Gammaproteobacteria bacterium]|jgi:sec-independent protein translocase protein TatB|nr:Sec-independent protein translocase protein TatB [Gammaproteobacteria bacterium]MCW8942667.1 Sec-independent protein translocase protein TatB [Gammaproteobacteria bacterium]